MPKSILIIFSFLFIMCCQDDLLDPSVIKSASNDEFKLSLSLSDDVVHEDGNIKIDVALERTVDAPYFLPSKMLGEWYLREINGQSLADDSISIVYEFLADSTFGISKTFSFNNKSLGSQVLGKWEVYSDTKYNLEVGTYSTTTDDTTIGLWTVGDSTYTILTRDIIIIDSTRAFDYTFSNDYGLSLDDKIVFHYTTVMEIDTIITWDDTTGNSFEYKHTIRDTAYSADSTTTERDGMWDFSQDSTKTLTVHFYDIPGGEHNTFNTTFDIDIATIPVGSYMYWAGDDARSVVLKKTGSSTTFDSPDDSTASFQGGWMFTQSSDALTITTILNNEEETGTISFDTPGSVVPIGGNMYWVTDLNQYTFEKKADPSSSDPNFEGLDMNLIVSALGGDIYVLNSTTGSDYKSFDVEIGYAAGDEFEAVCFYEPSSSAGSSSYISAQFDDITLTISIYIIQD